MAQSRGLQGPEGNAIEAAAADLPAGERSLVHQEHPQLATRQLVGGQGTGGSGPDHDHVPLGSTHCGCGEASWGEASERRQLSR